jgi:uncharacterized protein YrzB (UPF0473 family)
LVYNLVNEFSEVKPMPELEDDVITLVDEEGEEKDFTVIDTLEVEGSQYAVLLPLEEEDEDEVVILKYGRDEHGNEILMDIEDDEEWERVADAWQEMVEEELEEEEEDL